MTDFQALCAELVGDIEEWMNGTDHFPPSSVELLDRARAAMAQPEPQGPTDEELLEVAAKTLGYKHIPSDETCLTAEAGELLEYARAVLARWNRPAIEPQQEGDHG